MKYLIYMLVLVFTALAFFFQVSPTVASAHYQETINITTVDMAFISGAYLVVYGAVQLPNGYILDKFGVKYLYIYALSILLGVLLIKVYESLPTLYICRLLIGLGCSIAFTSGVYIAKSIFSEERTPLFISVVTVFASLGAIFATKVSYSMLETYGWGFAQNTLLIVVIMLCVLLFIVSYFYYRKHNKLSKVTLSENIHFSHKIRLIFSQKILISIFLYTFFTWFTMTSFAGYWAKDYFIVMHHYTDADALNVMQIYWGFYLLSSLVISYFMKSISRCISTIKYLAFLHFAIFLFMAIPVVFNHTLIMFVIVIAGISTSGSAIGFAIISLIVRKEILGMAVAINNTFLVFGGLAGQLLFGVFVNIYAEAPLSFSQGVTENYYFALLLLPSASLIAFMPLFLFLKKKNVSRHI